MKRKRTFVIAAIGIICMVLVAFAAAYFLLPPQGGGPADKVATKELENAARKPEDAKAARRAELRRKRGRMAKNRPFATGKLVNVDLFEGMSPEDRKLAESVQEALDSDDHKAIISTSVKALASTNPNVRREAVEALGWCGQDALAELTGVLADPDDDVRDLAINNWECALAEVESPKIRFSTALSVMGTITYSDAIGSISGQFGTAAQEYIDEVEDEEGQGSRRVEIVQQLLDIIEGPKEICAEKAREAYNDLTGYEWMGIEEAEKYLSNPDDYEPPGEKDEVAADMEGATDAGDATDAGAAADDATVSESSKDAVVEGGKAESGQ